MEQHGAESHDDDEGCDPRQCWWHDRYGDDRDSRFVSGITLPKDNMRKRSASRSRETERLIQCG